MKETIYRYIWYILPCLALVTIGMNIWKAFHGIMMHDDAYYLFLLRDMPNIPQAAQYQNLFHNIWDGNIAAVKITGTLMDLLASLIFAFGLCKYLKIDGQKMYVNIASITYLAQSCFTILITAISYVTLNRFIFLVAIGLILWAMTIYSSYAKSFLYLLSGWLCGFILFVMITNMPLVGILLLFILIAENSTISRLSGTICFVAGIVLAWITYFTTAEPFNDYITHFTQVADKALHGGIDPSHSIKGICLWIYQSITLFYLKDVVICSLVLLGGYHLWQKYKEGISTHKIFFLVIWIGTFLMACIYWRYDIWRKGYSVASVVPFMALYVILFFQSLQNRSWKLNVLYTLLFFVPFFVSMGTDQTLKFRAHEYMCFLLPIILIEVYRNFSKKYLLLLIGIVGVYWLTTTVKISKGNWGWLVYTEQTKDIRTIGLQHLYVSTDVYNNLKSMQEIIKEDDRLAVSNNLSFGYMYLLGNKPLTWDLRQRDVYERLENLQGDELKMIENQWYPYRESYLDSIRIALHKDTVLYYPYADGRVIYFE